MASSRFVNVSDTEITSSLENKEKPNTKKVRDLYWGLFIKYIGENYNLNEVDLSTINHSRLNEILMKYYASVRTKTSDLYKLKSYTSVHWAVTTSLEKILQVNLFHYYQGPTIVLNFNKN